MRFDSRGLALGWAASAALTIACNGDGTARSGEAGAGGPASPAASASALATVSGAGPGGGGEAIKRVLVRIYKKGTECDHEVTPSEKPIRLKANVDLLQWVIVNECDLEEFQPILLCVYKKDDTYYNPFNRCNPEDINAVFRVNKNQKKLTTCVGRDPDPDGYRKQVLTGSEISGLKCPPSPIPERRADGVLAHIVDIAIEP